MNRFSPERKGDRADQGNTLLRAALIVGAGLWAFSPALRGEWIWDDGFLVAQNGLVHDPAGLWKIWFDPKTLTDYLPLKVSVEWLEWRLWHNDTLGYHLVNVVLHLTSSLLIWRLLGQLGLRLAWLGGLLFAIHPVTVESVAWISELKNTLSLPPFLLAMSAYLDYAARGRKRDYFLAVGLFLVAMLCKATMIMFPVVLLLHAWWKNGRVRWIDLKVAAPFFAISFVIGLITLSFVQDRVAGGTIPMGGPLSRLACAGLSYSFYISKCILPINLMPIYPRWNLDPPTLWQFLPGPILIALLCFCWSRRATWGRHALFGLGFFLITLAPFVGLTAGSYMNFTWVMDHLLYIPLIGVIGLAVAALGQLEDLIRPTDRIFFTASVTVVVALLAWGCHSYATVFGNGEKLWSYAAAHNPNAWPALNNLGTILLARGDLDGATNDFDAALRLHPTSDLYNNLGLTLLQAKRMPEAIAEFKTSLRFDPRYPATHNNLGLALMEAKRVPEAIAEYEQASRLNARYPFSHYNLGVALAQEGRVPEAITQFEAALRLDSDYPEARNNLGSLLLQRGEIPQAMAQFAAILKVDPNNAVAHYNMGDALMQTGQVDAAIEQFRQALRLSPQMAEAHYSLGNALIQNGHLSEAIDEYLAALKIDPDYADAQANLGNAQLQSGRTEDAIGHYQQALQLTPGDTDVRKTLGLVLMKAGRVPEAKNQFEAILQTNPQDADAQKFLRQAEAVEKNHPSPQ